MKIKCAFFVLVATILFASVFPAMFMLVVDPYTFYHKPIFRDQKINGGNVFLSAAGMIKSYLDDPKEGFDSVVIGSSTSVNYTSEMMREYLGWKNTMNLSIPGTNPDHHQVILEAILRRVQIKNVFIELSYHYALDGYTFSPEPMSSNDGFFFPELYDDNVFNDIPFWFMAPGFYEALKISFGDVSEYRGEVDAPARWAGRKDFLDHIANRMSPSSVESAIKQLDDLKENNLHFLESRRNIDFKFLYFNLRLAAPLLRYCNNKSITFILNFSPRPALEWLTDETAAAEFFLRRYAVNKFSACENIKIYAEDQYIDIVNRPDSFLDVNHYSPALSEFILNEVAKNENQLTTSTIDHYEKQVLFNIRSYRSYLSQLLKTDSN